MHNRNCRKQVFLTHDNILVSGSAFISLRIRIQHLQQFLDPDPTRIRKPNSYSYKKTWSLFCFHMIFKPFKLVVFSWKKKLRKIIIADLCASVIYRLENNVETSVVDPDSLNSDPDQGFWWPEIGKKYSWFFSFLIKNFNFLFLTDVQATEQAFSPQKRTSSTSKMKFLNSMIIFVVIFALLDPDPDLQHP